jgi:hypothetical protein
LARETKGLVSTGNIERTQVERHHQQGLTPLVVIDADCQRDGRNLRFSGKIRNIGPGPATGVYFCVKPIHGAAAEKYGRGLAAGEVWDFDLSWDMGLGFGVDLVPYDCLVCFSSIFATDGVVQQYSSSGRRLDLSMRTMILPDRSKPGEAAEIKATFLGAVRPLPAFGEMGPRWYFGCQTVAVDDNRYRPASTQRQAEILVYETFRLVATGADRAATDSIPVGAKIHSFAVLSRSALYACRPNSSTLILFWLVRPLRLICTPCYDAC